MNEHNEVGVLYIATGEEYVNRMCDSIESLRTHMPNVPITAATDEKIDIPGINNKILSDVDYDYGDSIIDPGLSPYNRTLFLDADTYICEDLSDIFELLNEFDIAIAHNPERDPKWFKAESAYTSEAIPPGFPQYNSGVIAFNDTDDINSLFNTWDQIHRERSNKEGYNFNQPALREALYNSDLRIATLPPEYNLRVNRPGYLNGPVKIIHGDYHDYNRLKEILNSNYKSRVYYHGWNGIKVRTHRKLLSYRVLYNFKSNGIIGSIKKIVNRI